MVEPTQRALPRKGTLAAVVGIGVATYLLGFIPQEESGRTVQVTMTDDGTATMRHVTGKQYLQAYLDIVKVATACDGLTTDEFGRKLTLKSQFTEAQCATMLERALVVHAEGVMACTPGLALPADAGTERVRQGPRFAAVSLAYNIGVRGYCTSTAAARFNARNYPGGCTAMTWFNKAGGRVNRGLTGRRARENRVCIGGLAA